MGIESPLLWLGGKMIRREEGSGRNRLGNPGGEREAGFTVVIL
jgi:hypothetical protein